MVLLSLGSVSPGEVGPISRKKKTREPPPEKKRKILISALSVLKIDIKAILTKFSTMTR